MGFLDTEGAEESYLTWATPRALATNEANMALHVCLWRSSAVFQKVSKAWRVGSKCESSLELRAATDSVIARPSVTLWLLGSRNCPQRAPALTPCVRPHGDTPVSLGGRAGRAILSPEATLTVFPTCLGGRWKTMCTKALLRK